MQKRRKKPAAHSALPLRPAAFAILASLANGPLPGFEILETVNSTVRGTPIWGPGTLYRLLRELRRSGWIQRTKPPSGETDPDERRQYHALTAEGRAVMRAEAGRLRVTLANARLLPQDPRST